MSPIYRLHVSSSSIVIPLDSAYPGPESAQFGRQVNETLCDWSKNLYVQHAYPDIAALCGLDTVTSGEWTWSMPEGLRTLSGSSNVNMVAVTDDSHVILVPPSTPQDVAYVASSLGVHTACARCVDKLCAVTGASPSLSSSITRQCMHPDPVTGGWVSAVPMLNCTGYPLANITNPSPTGYWPFGVVDTATGNVSVSAHWRSVNSKCVGTESNFDIQC